VKKLSDLELLSQSGLYDEAWYINQYPDVQVSGISPLEHFLRIGIFLERNPGPAFDSSYYLKINPDVKAANMPAILHYLRHGQHEGRLTQQSKFSAQSALEAVDVVVPVFNALEDTQRCLKSLVSRRDGFSVRIIIVNDGSNAETTDWLRYFAKAHSCALLIENPGNQGYTKTINTGLSHSSAAYVVTLNSDTIVTSGWLKGLVRCAESDPRIGIVGPLSNAASWQNVPNLYSETGDFAVNSLPPGITPDDMARIVSEGSIRKYPKLPFVNGFCFLIKRKVIESIGYMDEERFPLGYGEENDFCIRAADAGFDLAIADDSYVFHAKSKSFGHTRRRELSASGSSALKEKHTSDKYTALTSRVKRDASNLEYIRQVVKEALDSEAPHHSNYDILGNGILFVLPVRGGGGGSHSVVQEVAAMKKLGARAAIAVRMEDIEHIRQIYNDIDTDKTLFIPFSQESIVSVSNDYDIAIATVYSSVELVQKIFSVNSHILPAYYIQDYEPLFFGEGSPAWLDAALSYTLIPEAFCFAKTEWIARTVNRKHGTKVHKVAPSLDHNIYKPASKNGDRISIAAMIRPQTPVRGAERTMRIFERISNSATVPLEFNLFGCDSEDPRFKALPQNFDFKNHGVLNRLGVAEVLRQCDIFVDLSDYQAFGRTGIEAMACGCAVVLPLQGGTDEYAIDKINSCLVDTSDEDASYNAIVDIITAPAKMAAMQRQAMLTAANYSVHKAAISELVALASALERHRRNFPKHEKQGLTILPALRGDGLPTGSAFVRTILPYSSVAVNQRWAVKISTEGSTLNVRSSVVMLQRDAQNIPLSALKEWHKEHKESNRSLIYEIDDDLFDSEALVLRGAASPDVDGLVEKVKWLCSTADMVTVSTDSLAARVRKFNDKVYVVPNRLDIDLWKLSAPRPHEIGPYRRTPEGPVRIGYIGTPTHGQDLEIVREAMTRLKAEFGSRIEIEIIGGFSKGSESFGRRIALPKRTDYPNFVRWLLQRVHWDIGFIPLVNDEFNECKSNLKFLEYAALDMAIVCSAGPTYENIARDRINSLVVDNSSDAWYAAISELINDVTLRTKLASTARAFVAESHTIQSNGPAYNEILEFCKIRNDELNSNT